MAKTYYAWSTFPVEFNEYGNVTNSIKPGDQIKKSDLKCSDEEWEEYIDRGIVSEEQYPQTPQGISPVEYFEDKNDEYSHIELELPTTESVAQTPSVPESEVEEDVTGETGSVNNDDTTGITGMTGATGESVVGKTGRTGSGTGHIGVPGTPGKS